MFLRLYPKFAKNVDNNLYIEKVDKDIYALKNKLGVEEEAYKKTVFEDYYYIINNKYKTILEFPYNSDGMVVTKIPEVVTMNELPKGNQKYVYLEFTYGSASYQGYIQIERYMVWSRNIIDKTVKIIESEHYQEQKIQIPNSQYRIDSIDGDKIYVKYFKEKIIKDQTSTVTNTYSDIEIVQLLFTKEMLKNSFWDSTNKRYLKKDLFDNFTCNKRNGCTLYDGKKSSKKNIIVNQSDVNHSYYLNSSEWDLNNDNNYASSVYGSNEVGDEITNFYVGLPLILKDSTGFITSVNLNAVTFYPKFDYSDYSNFGFGTSSDIIREKIKILEDKKATMIARKSVAFFDFPVNNDYRFSLTDNTPLDQEIKEAVNTLAFGLPNKVVALDNATRSMNFREQEAFNQFGTSTIKTHSSKTEIKINTIEGTLETSTISGILEFLRLLYLSTPKLAGNDDNIFMQFGDKNQSEILEYLQDIQDIINSKRTLTTDIQKDSLYNEGSSVKNVFNLITEQLKSYFDLGSNIIEDAVDETLGNSNIEKSIKNKDKNFKTSSSTGFTADYVDFSLYEIVDGNEYFLFDSRNRYDDQSVIDKLLDSNSKFATIAIPGLVGLAVGGSTGGLIGTGLGGATLITQEVFGNKSQKSEANKEVEVSFVISKCKFTFSPTSGKIADGVTFPTYVKYSIDLESKKAPLLNDVLRMLLLHQMIVSESTETIDQEKETSLEQLEKAKDQFNSTIDSTTVESVAGTAVGLIN